MDPDSPIARVERTFWNVWNYITVAVNRFLRPVPTDIVSNEPNSLQESAVDNEPANCGHTVGDTCRGQVDEEQGLAAASLLSSSRPVVAWELCTTEINLGHDEENRQDKCQLSRGSDSKASEEGDGTREGQFTQSGNDGTGLLIAEDAGTKEDKQVDSRGSERKSSEEDDDMREEQFTQSGNDDAGPLIAKATGPKEDEQEENKGWKLDIPERDGIEGHANTVSLNAADDAMSEDIEESGRKEGDEEESGRAMTQEDPQKMDETVTNIQIQEEHSEMQCEVEHDNTYSHTVCSVEAEETEIKLCTLTDLSLKEDATHVEAETAVTPEEVETSDGVLQVASENENNRQAENLLSVCEELSDVDRNLECGPSVVSSDATLMADDKSVILSDDDQIVKGQEQVMLERTEMIMYDIAEDEKEEDESAVDFEEHSVVIMEGNVNELAGTTNNKTSDEVPEQENDIETVTEDNQEEDITTECVACSEDFTQTATTELYKAEFTDGEQEHVAEDTEVKTKTTETDDVEIKSYGAVNDEKSDGNKAGAEQERLLNEDDNNEECMEIACATTAVTVKPDGEAGQEISREFKNIPPGIFESGMEAEKTEVKLCTLTDLSLKEDATCVEAERAVTPEEVENSDGVLQLASENENNRQAENLLSVCEELSDVDRDLECGPSVVSSDATLMADDKSVILSDDDQIVKGQEQMMLERTEMIMYDIAEDEKEEDESAVDFEEHSVVIKEENVNELAGTTNNKTSDEVPKQENDMETVTEDNQEEDITTECVSCSEDFTQSATTELYKAEFTDGEQEHVAEDTEVNTKTTETDDVGIKSYGAVNDEKSDGNKAGAEQERLLNEDDNNEECMEIACATTAVTVKPDGEAGQEISREFKNIPPGIFESGMEAEETEVKLCTLTDLSLKEDATCVEAERAVTPEEVENSDGVLQLVSENENNRQAENLLSVCEELSDVYRDLECGPSVVSSDATLMADDKSVILSDDDQIVKGQEQAMLERTEMIMYDIAEDEKEEEDESAVYDEEHGVIMEGNVNELAGTTNNKTSDEVPEQENDIETVTEDNQEEDITTECVACSEDFTQTATTELYKAEFTDGEQEHVAEDTEVKTKTRETDNVEIKRHGAVIDEKSDGNKAGAEQERLLNEDDNNEGCLEIACATTVVTVKPDGEAGQEISREFKNIPPGIFEGQTVVSQELNSTTYEEAQEGVPEYNNEPGPYENTTQRILEGGDDEVIQTTQLPEEVESEELKSLQHSGSSSDYLLLKERMETEQDSRLTTTEDGSFDEDARILSITDAKELEKPFAEPVIQESGHLPVQEEGQLLDSSMKTGISEKEFETHIDSANNKTTKELQDGTEEFLVEFEVDEGLWDSREADAARGGHEATGAAEEVARFADETLKLLDGEAQKISFFEESENAISSTSRMFSLLGDVAEPGFLKQPFETELKLLEDHTAETQDATNEMQDAWTGMEETSYGFEEKVAEDEMQSKNDTEILNRQVVELASELTTDTDKKESAVIARLESSTHIKAEAQVNTLDTQVQLSEEAQEEILTDTETAEDSMRTESGPKHLTEMSPEEITEQESDGNYTEETGSPVRGHPDMIEEEILDLWIQAALTDETVDTKEQEQKMDTEMEPPNEEQDEIHSEKEHLMESNSLESGLVSDSEISLSTAESGILDQSFGEWGTQNSETWLPESFQGTDHIFASMPASTDISELSIKQEFEPQDLLIEVTAEAGQSYLKDEESITVTDQESDKLQEKTEEERVESVEVGAASQKDANVMPKMTSPFAVDHTNIEDEPLEITVSDSLSVISSGQSRSGSEDSLQDGIVLTDSGLQGETCVEMKLPSLDEPQALWSEDITEPSSGLIGAEVAQQSRTKSEGQIEVNAPVLDFTAQRSRIAVKNPHVRPPKDPRSLLHMPSVDPTPSTRLPVKVLAGVPLGGMGIGIKLPGLGAGFPVLKKTQRVVRDENNPATSSQESEKKPEDKDDAPKQDEVPQKPKWMPPKHPGFGNPLMSELKTKLKKTTKD